MGKATSATATAMLPSIAHNQSKTSLFAAGIKRAVMASLSREGIARSIAQHKRSENEGGRRNPVKSGASVRSSRVGFASNASFRARRDRGRLPPTTGPVCQG
jgi:hypothetical protein